MKNFNVNLQCTKVITTLVVATFWLKGRNICGMRSLSILSLFQYFVFEAAIAEHPFSQRQKWEMTEATISLFMSR